MSKIIILGGGSWGLSMANMLDKFHHNVTVWEINQAYVDELKEMRSSTRFLPNIKFCDSIFFSSSLQEVFKFQENDLMILAIPSQYVRETVKKIIPYITKQKSLKGIINLAKGLEISTLKRMSEVIKEELPVQLQNMVSTLSGPSHAEEVAKENPTAIVLAGNDPDSIKYVQKTITNHFFRVYTSTDLIGVEIGGAVKNIISIAAGIIDGLGFGDNTKGALLTRGIAEIQRLGIAVHADPKTFQGLSGIGDLITTSISLHSRNRHVGYELGKGRSLEEILSQMVMVAEGINSTKAIWKLKEELKVEMPITEQIYQVLFLKKNPRTALTELMTRSLKDEY